MLVARCVSGGGLAMGHRLAKMNSGAMRRNPPVQETKTTILMVVIALLLMFAIVSLYGHFAFGVRQRTDIEWIGDAKSMNSHFDAGNGLSSRGSGCPCAASLAEPVTLTAKFLLGGDTRSVTDSLMLRWRQQADGSPPKIVFASNSVPIMECIEEQLRATDWKSASGWSYVDFNLGPQRD